MTHGRDMLRMSAGTMGRDPGKSSLFTPYATQQHRETRAKPQDCNLALLFMVQLQARMGCLYTSEGFSHLRHCLWALNSLKKSHLSHSFLSMPGCFNFQQSSQKKWFCQLPQKELFLTDFLPRISRGGWELKLLPLGNSLMEAPCRHLNSHSPHTGRTVHPAALTEGSDTGRRRKSHHTLCHGTAYET